MPKLVFRFCFYFINVFCKANFWSISNKYNWKKVHVIDILKKVAVKNLHSLLFLWFWRRMCCVNGLDILCIMYISLRNGLISFPYADTFRCICSRQLSKHWDKRNKWDSVIVLSFIEIFHVLPRDFKVVCFRFDACRKGLRYAVIYFWKLCM